MNQIKPSEAFAQTMRDPFALFELFGFRNAKHISDRSQDFQAPLFERVHQACQEIWKNRRLRMLTEHDESTPGWDRTREFMREMSPPSLPSFLARVKRCCHFALPFPAQQLLFEGFLPEAEAEKQRALGHLFASLGAEPAPLEPNDLWNMMRLYYSQGALVINRKSYYFSDLVSLWNRPLQQRLAASFPCQPLLPPPREPEPFTEPLQQETFPAFLTRCSILAFEQNCQIELPDSFRAVLQDLFQQHESLRADAAYVTVDLPRLYELDLTGERWKNRPSAKLLRLVQMLYFTMQREGVLARERGAILERLFQAEKHGNPYQIPDFAKRQWISRDLVDGESRLDAVFIGYNRLLQLIYKEEFASIYQKNGWCCPLLYLLWSLPHASYAIRFFTEAAKSGRFALTLKILYDFCLRNLPSMRKEEDWQVFTEEYFGAIDALQVKAGAEGLFLDPPLQLPSDWPYVGLAKQSIPAFVEAMQPYSHPKDRKYVEMFRRFLFHKTGPLFTLLRDIPVLGIGSPSTEFLEWALTSSHGAVDAKPLRSREEVARAVRHLKQVYGFRDTETFSLYLELLRIPNWQEMIGRSATLIDKLKELCPALMRESIYFLFRYHPDGSLPEVGGLLELQRNWVANQAIRNSVVISRRDFSQIFEPVQRFVQNAAASCPVEEKKTQFASAFLQSVLGAFLPPLQPLMDFFRITGISAQGIQWTQRIWNTHLGQVTFVLPKAAVGIYIHWTIQAGRPVLFFSFANLGSRRAQSLFLPIEFPLNGLDSRDKERTFYSFLFELSQHALREEADRDVGPGEDWTQAYHGLPESIEIYQKGLHADLISAVLTFMADLKRSYRQLFLDTVQDAFTPTVFTPEEMAASGSIFPSHPRGALLTQALLDCQPEPKWYIPDTREELIEGYLRLFEARNQKPELLNLDLQIKGTDPLPIFYHVQSTEDLALEALGERHQRQEQARDPTGGTYVTLSVPLGPIKIPLRYPPEALRNSKLFQNYMDYHLLLLKAFVYRYLQVTPRLPRAQGL